MAKARPLFAGTAAVLLAASPLPAPAVEWEAFSAHRYFTQSLPEEMAFALFRFPQQKGAPLSRTTYQLNAFGRVAGRPLPEMGLELGLDTGLIEIGGGGLYPDSSSLVATATQAWFLGPTFVDLQLGPDGIIQIKAGKLFETIGSPAILQSYTLGAMIDMDPSFANPEAPWRVRAFAVLPDATMTSRGKQNPLLEIEVGWAFTPEVEVRLFGAFFLDSEDGLAPVVQDALFRELAGNGVSGPIKKQLLQAYQNGLIGVDTETSGQLSWFGARGQLAGERAVLRASAIVQLGRFDATLRGTGDALELARKSQCPPGSRRLICRGDGTFAKSASVLLEDVAVQAFFAELTGEYDVTDVFTAGGFAVYASGDDGFGETESARVDRSFLSLAPHIGHTSIFFTGGASQTIASPSVASIAPDGSGLIGAGVNLAVRPHDSLEMEAVGAWFRSAGAAGEAGTQYGFEVDAIVEWRALDWLQLAADAGVFFPGGYYGDGVPLAYQVIAGIEVGTP